MLIRATVSRLAVVMVLTSTGLIATAADAVAQSGTPCASGDVCVADASGDTVGVLAGGSETTVTRVSAGGVEAVNNTDSDYSSEGDVVLQFQLDECVYTPDSDDEQAPGATENLTDGIVVGALAVGPAADDVDYSIIVPMSDCGV